jgi:glycerol uptake facilitator-like aquaporin
MSTVHMSTARSLGARALAEGLGTGFLVAVVIGSGIAAERLSPGEVGLQLLENSTATVLALAALILTFGPVSGAHFNPAVTLSELATGKLDPRAAVPYIGAQLSGGCAGAIVANLMFELPAVELATNDRISAATFLAEVVATFGLLTVIFGVVRSGRLVAVPVAVAGYIGAAYWFTSSTSFANPAVTVARTLSDSFTGIRPASAPGFIAAQLLGAALAVVTARVLFPEPEPSLEEALDAGP